jgi:hypothetical protein
MLTTGVLGARQRIDVPKVREITRKMREIREAYDAAVPLPPTLDICEWIDERLTERFGADAPLPVELELREGEITMTLEHADLSPGVTMRTTISSLQQQKSLVIVSTIDGAGSRIMCPC